MRAITRAAGTAVLLATFSFATGPAAAGNVLFVPFDFPDPLLAVAGANDGDTIMVKGGSLSPFIINETLTIDKPLTIYFDGTAFNPPAGQPAIDIRAGGNGDVSLYDLNVFPEGGAAILVNSAANVTINNMDMQGNGEGTGILIKRNGDLNILNSEFTNLGTGVQVRGGTNGHFFLDDSIFRDIAVGIDVGNWSGVVSDNVITDNRIGVKSDGDKTVELKKNKFFNNVKAAVGDFLSDGTNNVHGNRQNVVGSVTENPGI